MAINETIAELTVQLAGCPGQGQGGFCDHPEAFVDLAGPQADEGYGQFKLRLAAGATEAGEAGTLLSEATYIPWHTRPGQPIVGAFAGRNELYRTTHLVDGEPELITDAVARFPEGRARGEVSRIASCAHACGAIGAGRCLALKTEGSAS